MSSTTIYAASDDLIEVEGDISEEFSNPDFASGAYVYTSAGHVLRFRLEDEGWRATVVFDPAPRERSAVQVVDDDGDDRVTVAWPLNWVVATTVAPARDGA